MRQIIFGLAFVLCAISATCTLSPVALPAQAQDAPSNLDKLAIYKCVRQCSVKVYAEFDDETAFHGTGVAIRRFDDLVLIATNSHVVNLRDEAGKPITAPKITCKPWQKKGDTKLSAYYLTCLYNEALYWDVAFLLVRDPAKLIATAAIATVRDVKIGTSVYACGNPRDEEFLVDDGEIIEGEFPNAHLGQMMAHNALIEHGSSGGGLFNAKGELIGINTWMVAERYGVAQDITYFLEFFRFGSAWCSSKDDYWNYVSPYFEKPADTLYMEPGMNLIGLALGKWQYDTDTDAVNSAGVSGVDEGRVSKDHYFGALLMRVGESITPVDRANYGPGKKLITYDDARTTGVVRGTGDVCLRMNDTKISNNSGNMTLVYVIIGNPLWYIGVDTEEPTEQEREKWNLWHTDEKGKKSAIGAKVTKVHEFSDAAAGGIKVGDFIVSAGNLFNLDDPPVTSKTLKSVVLGFREKHPDKRVWVNVRHEGKDSTVFLGLDGK